MIALAVSLRTTHAVESYETVMDRAETYIAPARAASVGEGVELSLLLSVACAESAGRPEARSRAGAVGLMQLEDATSRELAASRGEGKPDRADPATSLRLGARYLRKQLDRFAATPCPKELALAAYNAGPGAVQQWLDRAPAPGKDDVVEWIRFPETRAYVVRVLDYETRWTERIAPRR